MCPEALESTDHLASMTVPELLAALDELKTVRDWLNKQLAPHHRGSRGQILARKDIAIEDAKCARLTDRAKRLHKERDEFERTYVAPVYDLRADANRDINEIVRLLRAAGVEVNPNEP